MLALAVAASGLLVVRRAEVSPLWADHGSGSGHDVSLGSTRPPDGFFALSDYAQVGYDEAGTFVDWAQPYGPPVALREINSSGNAPALLKEPTGWASIYTATASQPLTLWRATPAAGYVAVGDVATTDGKPPPRSSRYMTVHRSCAVPCKADVLLWADKDGHLALYGTRGLSMQGEQLPYPASHGGFIADAINYPSAKGARDGQTAVCLKSSCVAPNVDVPEQLHIALGRTPDVMAVQWAAAVGASSSALCKRGAAGAVHYGKSGGPLGQVAAAECTAFDVAPSLLTQENWNATLSGLAPSTTYDYYVTVGPPGARLASEKHSFVTAPDASTLASQLPHQFIIYGDLGHDDPTNSSTIMPFVARDVLHGPPGLLRPVVDMVLHVGDFAYDFDANGGNTGRLFMNDIANYSTRVPYMVCAGNHDEGFGFAHYTEFFRSMPADTGTIASGASASSPNNWWFSWNYGLVHFVTINTEFCCGKPYQRNIPLTKRMVAWLEADLAAASANRTLAPWVIVNGHRPLYCSCDRDCDESATAFRETFEHLFYHYGVDMFICGHEHNYERMFDVAPAPNASVPWLSGKTTRSTLNMPATTYIVVGSAGNREDHEPFTRAPPPRTALALDEYGYGRMLVYNATHLHWQFVLTDGSQSPPEYDVVGDEVMLVQHKHGPFDARG